MNEVAEKPGCTFPDCPSKEIELDRVREHAEVKKQLESINELQGKMLVSVNQVLIRLSDLGHLTEDFRDFREQSRKAHENIFHRLGGLESGKADKSELSIAQESIRSLAENKSDKSDVQDIKKTGLSWIWQLLMIFGGVIFGFILRGVGLLPK